jgi:hypothetical protein
MSGEDLEDSIMDYAEARFEIRPYPTYSHLMRINNLVNELGYRFPFSMKQYSLEDVQEKLRAEGPQAFLRYVRLQEDISPKAPLKGAAAFVAERLARLAPTSDLVIIDPYLFPPRPKLGEIEYAAFLAGLVAPILEPGATVKCVVNGSSNAQIEEGVRARLGELVSGVTMEIHRSDDFHDRFWIADRTRGVVVGASLNGLGSKLFLVDELKTSDVTAIVEALDETSDYGVGRDHD